MKKIAIQDRSEAETLMHTLAGVENARRIAIALRDEEVLKITEKYAGDIDAMEAEAKDLRGELVTWAKANPQEVQKGTKTIVLPSGDISHRINPPSLQLVKGWNWERVLGAVIAKMPNFIRQVPEVDKANILAQRDELASELPGVGLRVQQKEEWKVDPNLTDPDAVTPAK